MPKLAPNVNCTLAKYLERLSEEIAPNTFCRAARAVRAYNFARTSWRAIKRAFILLQVAVFAKIARALDLSRYNNFSCLPPRGNSAAACTKSRNNGCGRSGRDLNSG